MCGSATYSSPIALALPSTLWSFCPVSPMANDTIGSWGRYVRMDSMSLDFVQAAPVMVRGQLLSYYAAIAVALVAVWIYQSLQASRASKVKVPFYKASIIKWYFSAETLLRDSYLKVRANATLARGSLSRWLTRNSVLRPSAPNQGHRGCPSINTSKIHCRVESAT